MRKLQGSNKIPGFQAWMRTFTQYFYSTPDFMLGKVSIIFLQPQFPWQGQLYVLTGLHGLFSQETRIGRVNSGTYLFQMVTENQWLHQCLSRGKASHGKQGNGKDYSDVKTRLFSLSLNIMRALNMINLKILFLFSHSF